MTREKALKDFEKKHKKQLKEQKIDFENKVQEHLPKLVEQIQEAFSFIYNQTVVSEKKDIIYFHFSLLRCDVAKRKYSVCLQVQDMGWFLDENQLWYTFDINYFFEEHNKLWDILLDDCHIYMGKVNHYDIDFWMEQLAIECFGLIAPVLRYSFRDIEKNASFAAIPKTDLWDIRWGEYRDKSELIACVDRIPKTLKQWNASVRKANKSEGLTMSYWYQTEITNGKCDKKLIFATFEDCHIINMDFSNSDLTGATFRSCLLLNCNFQNSILKTAYFEECKLENPNFENAEMDMVAFRAGDFPGSFFSQEQLEKIRIGV